MICYNLPMEKWHKFIPALAIMLLLVAGTSWFILYVFGFVFEMTPATLLVAKTVCAILPILLVVTMLIGRGHYSKLNAWMYIVASLWIPIFMYLFLLAVVLGLLYNYAPIELLQKITLALLAVTMVSFVFGIKTALNPKIKTYTIKAPRLKEKWGDKKIVLFSDSHLGVVRHANFMQKIVDMINTQKPDIIFIAGDLIDGPVFPYEKGLAPLGELKSTFGTFFTAGNHDEYNIEQEKYYSILKKYVTVLNDKKVIVNDTQIIGVVYSEESSKGTEARLAQTGYEQTLPSIVMLHDPRNVPALAKLGVDLSLSGHTHGGQFFPVTLLVSMLYRGLTKGINYLGKTAHFTSVGVGTAGPLFRLGPNAEIVVIKIE